MFKSFGKKEEYIYADTAAATPVSDKVLKVMQPYSQEVFYNPSSLYPLAREAKKAIEQARKDIASLISVQPQTIVFTSGGTESAHLAIIGIISKAHKKGIKIPHVISSSFEHPAVDELLTQLHIKGDIALTKVDPEENGIVKVQNIIDVIHTDTVLICLMTVNNEIGTIQPVRKLCSELRNRSSRPFVYTDAAQAPQALGINRDQLGADLISFDSAKIYGPKGIGCLYIEQHVEINPIQLGGGQEHGMRSGTEPVSLIVGFAEAMRETIEVQDEQIKLHREIQTYFIERLKELNTKNIQYEINGSIESNERIPQNLNVCFKKDGQSINSEFLTIKLGEKGIMVSPGASCASNKTNSVSQSIEAIGKSKCASSSLRFTFGRDVSKKDIDYIVKTLIEIL
jgi:cysteine desulfurase